MLVLLERHTLEKVDMGMAGVQVDRWCVVGLLSGWTLETGQLGQQVTQCGIVR